MKAFDLRRLKGKSVQAKRRGSLYFHECTVLDVKGKNVLVDHGGMTDWLWIPDYLFKNTEAPSTHTDTEK